MTAIYLDITSFPFTFYNPWHMLPMIEKHRNLKEQLRNNWNLELENELREIELEIGWRWHDGELYSEDLI